MAKKKSDFISGAVLLEHGATINQIDEAKQQILKDTAPHVDIVSWGIKPDVIVKDADGKAEVKCGLIWSGNAR